MKYRFLFSATLILSMQLAACGSSISGTGPDSSGGEGGADSGGGGSPAGNGQGGGSTTDPGTGGDSGEAPTPTEDPLIDSIAPVDGAVSVPEETDIVIAFSEPMDPDSVESAFSLFVGNVLTEVEFDWTDDEDAVTITPLEPLPANEFTDPETPATIIRFELEPGAQSAAGRTLLSKYESSFTTPRHITQTLAPISTFTVRKFDGSYDWKDGILANPRKYAYISSRAETGYNNLGASMFEAGGNAAGSLGLSRGFVEFDLGLVPQDAQLESATAELTLADASTYNVTEVSVYEAVEYAPVSSSSTDAQLEAVWSSGYLPTPVTSWPQPFGAIGATSPANQPSVNVSVDVSARADLLLSEAPDERTLRYSVRIKESPKPGQLVNAGLTTELVLVYTLD